MDTQNGTTMLKKENVLSEERLALAMRCALRTQELGEQAEEEMLTKVLERMRAEKK